jgi:hypothetical protein
MDTSPEIGDRPMFFAIESHSQTPSYQTMTRIKRGLRCGMAHAYIAQYLTCYGWNCNESNECCREKIIIDLFDW